MSHEITNVTGKNEIAYVGETPWHGLGQELKRGATIEEWIVAAGMDWKVQRSKVRYATQPNAEFNVWDDQHVLFRSDTKQPLGLVSDRYKVVQPAQVLEFFRDLCADNHFTLATAGTLKGGKIYWALAEIGDYAVLPGNDKMVGHVLLSTSADGSRKTEAANVATRVVCANTLAMADGEKTASRIRVSHRSRFDADGVKAQLGIAHASFQRFIDEAKALANRRVSQADMAQYVVGLFHGADEGAVTEAEAQEILASKHAKAIIAKFIGNGRGAQMISARGTAWGLVNAVTEYVDHEFPARSNDNRLSSAWFGVGNALKTRAMEQALEMV